MSQIIHKNRFGCALHGALKVLQSIEGMVPIVHASAGCTIQSALSDNSISGKNGAYLKGGIETASTNLIEKHVVFGGTSRLREQIVNTVKVLKGELYVVLTGCVPEVVGDDIQAMVKEAKEQGYPVIGIGTPGFKGNIFTGYNLILKGLFNYAESIHHLHDDIPDKLINVLGIIPNHDLFWEGNLNRLKGLLELTGLHVNTLFGFGQNIQSIQAARYAKLNLVFSPWGLDIAKFLNEKYAIPYLYVGWIPTGSQDIRLLYERLSEKLQLDLRPKFEQILQNEANQKYQLSKIAEHYYQYNFQKEVALVGETSCVIGLARFLHHTLGQIVKTIIITDNPPEDIREEIQNALIFTPNITRSIHFVSQGPEINSLLIRVKPELILGSSLEQSAAKVLNVPLLKVTSPSYDRIILSKSYAGYSGAIELVEDISELLLKKVESEKAKSDYVKSTLNGLKYQARLVQIN